MARRYVLQVVVDVHEHDDARPVVDTDEHLGWFGGMPLLLTDESEADGYVKSLTILETTEV